MNEYYQAIIVLSMASMAIMIFIVCGNTSLSGVIRKKFVVLMAGIIVCAAAEWGALALEGAAPATRTVHILLKMLELSIAPAAGYLSASLLGLRGRREKLLTGILLVHAALEVLSARFGFIFYVDAENYYHHAGCYWIYVLVYLLVIIFLTIEAAVAVRNYQYGQRYILPIIMVFLITGLAIHIVNGAIRTDWLCMAMTCMMFYIFYTEVTQQTDVMTLLLNRRSYESQLNSLETRAAILFFDVDNFKEINDHYGHQVGDQCLAAIGEEIKKAYSLHGRCYRIGGDEFSVIATKKLKDVEKWNSDFYAQMAKRRKFVTWLPNVSVGYVIHDPDRETVEEAVKAADDRMYKNKENNKKKLAGTR